MLQAIGLALISSIGLGAADFVGGLASQRSTLMSVVLISLWTAAGILLAVTLLIRPSLSGSSVAWAVGSGVVTAVAVPILYAALASGPMSLVAPITSSFALVPAFVGVARGAVVGAVPGVGLVLTFIGVLIVTRAVPAEASPVGISRRGVILALAAAVGIGGATALLQAAASVRGGSPLGAAFVAAVAAALTVLIARAVVGRSRSVQASGLAIAAGGLSAAGLGFLAVASRSSGTTTIVAVLTSLSTVWVIVLARVFLHERLSRFQSVGVICALLGVVIVSAG